MERETKDGIKGRMEETQRESGKGGTEERRVKIEQRDHLAFLVLSGLIRNKPVTQTKL